MAVVPSRGTAIQHATRRHGDFEGAVGEELGVPSGLVEDLMVAEAQRGEVGGLGQSVVGPLDHVVDLAEADRTPAVGTGSLGRELRRRALEYFEVGDDDQP